MPISTKVSGTWRTVARPRVRVAGAWRNCQNVYVKVSGTWRRVWPSLVPGPVSSLRVDLDHVNDRANIRWSAAASGDPATSYLVAWELRDMQPGRNVLDDSGSATTTATSYTRNFSGVTDIHSGHVITVRVTPRNVAGSGPTRTASDSIP